jgi:hypothetical protein
LTTLFAYTHYFKIKNYEWWQIKIDPTVFDISKWMKDNQKQTILWSQRKFFLYTHWWFDNAIRKYVKRGHKVVIWVHGNPVGIYAVGEIVEPPFPANAKSEEKYYSDIKTDEENNIYLKIKLINDLFDNPIGYDITQHKGFSKYADSLLDLFINRKVPEKLPRLIPGDFERQTSSADFHGKLDVWGWIPIKSIDKDVGENISKYIKEMK